MRYIFLTFILAVVAVVVIAGRRGDFSGDRRLKFSPTWTDNRNCGRKPTTSFSPTE